MSAGKGDTPRAVNGEVFRRNFDSIFPRDGKNFDYPEGSKTKEQRIAAMIYAENLEQARLLAMSADREEKLVRERDEANRELDKQLVRYDALFDEAEKIRMERDEAREALQ